MVKNTNQDKEFHCECCKDNEHYWEEVDPDDMSLLEEQTIKFMMNLNNNQ